MGCANIIQPVGAVDLAELPGVGAVGHSYYAWTSHKITITERKRYFIIYIVHFNQLRLIFFLSRFNFFTLNLGEREKK